MSFYLYRNIFIIVNPKYQSSVKSIISLYCHYKMAINQSLYLPMPQPQFFIPFIILYTKIMFILFLRIVLREENNCWYPKYIT